ncbi:MAG: CotH kinase family protein [Paludibacteraceae bacterium]|nr:CotH kinase family protein [Paludibacteraceae bacterium]
MKRTELITIMLLASVAGNAQTVGVGKGDTFGLDKIDTAYSDGENHILKTAFPIGSVKRITFTQNNVPNLEKADNATEGNSLKRVFFTPQANNGKVLATVEGVKEGNVFSVFIPYLTDFSQLKASFVSTGDVWVNGALQKSGISINSFNNVVTYKVVSQAGDVQTYQVKVYNSKLPVVKINTTGEVPLKRWSDAYSATIATAGNEEVADFTTQIKGKGSRYSLEKKRSLNLKLENKSDFLGMGKSKRWVLLSNSQDASMLRTQAGRAVASVLDGLAWNASEEPVELVVGNRHMGTYFLSEQVRVEKDKVNANTLWQLATSAEPDEIAFKSDYTKQFCVLEDAAEDLTKAQAEEAFNIVRTFENRLYQNDFVNVKTNYKDITDLNSFADWLIANEVVKNPDAFEEAYFYINAEGKVAMGPIGVAAEFAGNNGQSATGFAVRNTGWFDRMMQDPIFAALVAKRYETFKSDMKSAAYSSLESMRSVLKTSQTSNEDLWNVFGLSGQQTAQKEAAYSKGIDELNNWLEERFKWLDLAFASEAKTAHEDVHTSMNEMKSFKLTKSRNGDALLQDYTATIKGDSVKVFVPYLVHFDLVPDFEVANGATVYVDNAEQTSGKSANNFLKTQNYKVVAQNGDVHTYKVCVYNSGIPVIYINTPGGKAINSKETWIENTEVSVYLKDGRLNYHAGQGMANIKGRGNSTWDATTEKRPYALKLNEKSEILGMLEHKRWVLMANYYDATFFRNDLANYLAKKCTNASWSPSGYNVELVLNGSHKGNYYFCEQVRMSDVRQDGVYLVEADRKANSGQIRGVKSGNYFNVKDPDVDNNSQELKYVKEILDNFENTLYGPNFLDSEKGYKKLADLESFVDWYLIKELSKDYDGNMFTSCYCHIMEDGLIKMGPIWDFDLAFGGNPFEKMFGGGMGWSWGGGGGGSTDYAWYNQPEGYHIADADWFVQMWKDPEFKALLRKRVDAMIADLDDIDEYIDFHTRLLTLSASANKVGFSQGGGGFSMWGPQTNNGPTKTYAEEMQVIKDFVRNRLLWMQKDLK